jgi:hypothetical protein
MSARAKGRPKGARRARGSAPPLLFVDAIDEGRARLLLDEDAFTVPARLLPTGARAGDWLRLSLARAAAPASDAAAIRDRLARGDRGGPIKL